MSDQVLEDMARRIGEQLLARALMLGTAESCTGGMVAAAVTSIAGSSAWFERGFVTYSNQSKVEMLGVAPDLIAQHGAVSIETAAAMAQGALASSRAQIALSITGIAGPGGAVDGKPVGTVCFGWAGEGFVTKTETCLFAGDRAAVRRQSALHALQGVLTILGRLPAGPVPDPR